MFSVRPFLLLYLQKICSLNSFAKINKNVYIYTRLFIFFERKMALEMVIFVIY